MDHPIIVFKVNDKVYKVRADHEGSLRKVPDEVRQQLQEITDAFNQLDSDDKRIEENAIADAPHESQESVSPLNQPAIESTPNLYNAPPLNPTSPERMGKGDLDNIAASLMAQDRDTQKPGVSKNTVYLWIAVIFIVFFGLIYFTS